MLTSVRTPSLAKPRGALRRPCPRSTLRVQSMFGWGRTKKMDDDRDEMWRKQQEILEERRSGSSKAVDEANSRRQEIQQKVDAKKAKKNAERAALARGEKLEPDTKKPYNEEEEGGIIIPIAPFGIPKFDNGERFDLKLPYVDEGWVDEDADPFKWAKGLFGGKKKGDETKKDDETKK